MSLASTYPHYRNSIRTLGVLCVSRRTPYCHAFRWCESIIPSRNGMRLVLGWGLTVAIPAVVLGYLDAGEVVLFLFFAVASGMPFWFFTRFSRFEQENSVAR